MTDNCLSCGAIDPYFVRVTPEEAKTISERVEEDLRAQWGPVEDRVCMECYHRSFLNKRGINSEKGFYYRTYGVPFVGSDGRKYVRVAGHSDPGLICVFDNPELTDRAIRKGCVSQTRS